MSERDDAIAEVKANCEATSNPTLTDPEIGVLVDNQLIAKTWAANTPFKYGDYIYPTVRNGLKYRVTRPGTTGADEPSWPNADTTLISGTVTLEFAGNELPSTYDIRAATIAGWRKKAGRAAKFMKTGGMDMSVIHDHCLNMVEEWSAVALVG